jgi:hypothetical protein
MGGICFMVSGSMWCGVTGSTLMVRVGREAYQRMLTQPHVRPMEFAGRRPTGFVLVDPGGYRTNAALARWIQRGIDFVSTLPAKTPAAKTPRRKALRRQLARISRTDPCVGPTLVGTQRLDQASLRRRQQLRERSNVMAPPSRKPERSAHIDADHVAARREPQLALAGEQHVPGLVLLPADQGVLAVGTEPPVGSRFTTASMCQRGSVEPTRTRETSVSTLTIIGLDIAKRAPPSAAGRS